MKEISDSSDSELSQEDRRTVTKRNYKQGQLNMVARINKYSGQNDSGLATSPDSRDTTSLDKSSSGSLEEVLMTKERRMSVMKRYMGGFDTVDQNQNNIELIKSPTSSQFVGFGLLPHQVYSKAMKKDFNSV